MATQNQPGFRYRRLLVPSYMTDDELRQCGIQIFEELDIGFQDEIMTVLDNRAKEGVDVGCPSSFNIAVQVEDLFDEAHEVKVKGAPPRADGWKTVKPEVASFYLSRMRERVKAATAPTEPDTDSRQSTSPEKQTQESATQSVAPQLSTHEAAAKLVDELTSEDSDMEISEDEDGQRSGDDGPSSDASCLVEHPDRAEREDYDMDRRPTVDEAAPPSTQVTDSASEQDDSLSGDDENLVLTYPDDALTLGYPDEDVATGHSDEDLALSHPEPPPSPIPDYVPSALGAGPLYRFVDDANPFDVVLCDASDRRPVLGQEDRSPQGHIVVDQRESLPDVLPSQVIPHYDRQSAASASPSSVARTPPFPRARMSAEPYPAASISAHLSSKPTSSASTGSCASAAHTIVAIAPATPRAYAPRGASYCPKPGPRYGPVPGFEPVIIETSLCAWPMNVPFDTSGTTQLDIRDVIAALAGLPDDAVAGPAAAAITRCGAQVPLNKSAILEHLRTAHGVALAEQQLFFCPICVANRALEVVGTRPLRVFRACAGDPYAGPHNLPESAPMTGLMKSSLSNHFMTKLHFGGRYTCGICGPDTPFRDSTVYWAHVYRKHVRQ